MGFVTRFLVLIHTAGAETEIIDTALAGRQPAYQLRQIFYDWIQGTGMEEAPLAQISNVKRCWGRAIGRVAQEGGAGERLSSPPTPDAGTDIPWVIKHAAVFG